LSKKDFSGMHDGARVDVDEYDKDAARDFALWKAVKPGEHFWETTLGPGRPGWHIECSAMAMQYLGNSFDLHAGGEDLMFPHHENEIAQSESATHQTFARHWFHVRFLLVDGRKMSKSLGNFYTLRDLLLKGYKASSIRSLLISVPYGQQLNFTFEGLAAETAAVERLRAFTARVREGAWGAATDATLLAETATAAQDFQAALRRDLNTAEARAAIFELVRKANAAADAGTVGAANAEAILALLARFDSVFQVLGDRDGEITGAALEWAESVGRLDQVPAELLAQRSLSDAQIEALMDERLRARKSRNFARSDAIRDELLAKGVVIEDSKEGARWRRK
jgi:cysteinyl-tRNA synthetase